MADSAFDVFLCHRSGDKPAVERIGRALRERGLKPWLDAWELRPGLPWQPALEAQIRTIRAAAVFVGAEGLGPWQDQELQAFLRQFVKRGCPVIPVILAECEKVPELPVFLEGMTWVDFRDESSDPLARLVWGITGDKPDLEPGETKPAAAKATRVSIARLPVTGEDFVARADELARLDAAWDDPATKVVSFVAPGGIGKSALVNRWLDAVAADGWRDAERVLGWSFYSQGTDAAGASSEAFTEFALDWLGYEGEVITSPWRKGEVLAGLVRAAPTLLVLDGLEPLQHPPGGQTGRIKDPAVQALVRELAVENPGLCVITTRLAVADVAGRGGAVAVDLEELPVAAGAELLRRLGVNGPLRSSRRRRRSSAAMPWRSVSSAPGCGTSPTATCGAEKRCRCSTRGSSRGATRGG